MEFNKELGSSCLFYEWRSLFVKGGTSQRVDDTAAYVSGILLSVSLCLVDVSQR